KKIPQIIETTLYRSLPAFHRRGAHIDRTAVVSKVCHRQDAAVSNDQQRLVSWSDETTGHAGHYSVFVLDAADGKIRCHSVDGYPLVRNEARRKGRHGVRWTKKASQPGQKVAGVFVGAADLEFIFRGPGGPGLVAPIPR